MDRECILDRMKHTCLKWVQEGTLPATNVYDSIDISIWE